ncbi:MAG: AhpC/TSA family protein [Bacteroidales bacterium]|nr:AhpC/TSA family protein [Bacteroidales bacterium]
MKRIALLIVALAAVAGVSCRNGAETYVIKGQVSDSLAKVPGVKALLMHEDNSIDTCVVVDGKFEFSGKADKLSSAVVFLSTPENPQPDFGVAEIMPRFFIPVIKEEGITEVFIGDEVKVNSGELSKRILDFQKTMLGLQIEINNKLDSDPDEETALKFIDSIGSQMLEKLKEFYEKNTDNVIGLNAFGLLVSELDADDIIRYWDMASDGIKADKDFRSMLEMSLSEKGLILNEEGKIVEKASGSTAIGKKFVDFEVKTIDGKAGRISDYLGKGDYVLMDFWAYWCGPCINEMKNLARINAQYSGKNFRIISVSIEDEEEQTLRAIRENNMTWTQLSSTDTVLDDDYGIMAIPYLILFSPDGTILEKNIRGAALDEALKKNLGE